MIAANELRIGNWIFNSNKYVQVNGLIFWHYQFPNDARHLIEINCLTPIALTPEILEKAGFEKTMADNYTIMDEDCWLYENKEGGYNYLMLYSSQPEWMIVANVLYLHQLQNLYFALIGKELEINII